MKDLKKEKLLQELTGDSYSFFERLKNKIFGSPRYDIISIEPDIFLKKHQEEYVLILKLEKRGLWFILDSIMMNMP